MDILVYKLTTKNIKAKRIYLFLIAVTLIIGMSSFADGSGHPFWGSEVESRGYSGTPDGSGCFELGFKDYYVFGIRVSNDTPVRREVDCDTNQPLGNGKWTNDSVE